MFLSAHPWCEDCLEHGNYEAATEVHHSIPHRGDKRIFWDKSQWRALSKRCHSKRTARGE
ncbi:HNH endonuclease [Desulfosporosinus sp. SB140]|uniref:HNH endonuclease n=1 Tax=Desulfosporosinus paludis TaxID=3115649 RepID=UPI0038901A16